jgi:hypothetical protein
VYEKIKSAAVTKAVKYRINMFLVFEEIIRKIWNKRTGTSAAKVTDKRLYLNAGLASGINEKILPSIMYKGKPVGCDIPRETEADISSPESPKVTVVAMVIRYTAKAKRNNEADRKKFIFLSLFIGDIYPFYLG